jgi:hypothetical protein
MMRRVAVLLLAGVAGASSAQVRNTQEGEAIVGLVGQDDLGKLNGVKILPVGINIGFIVQPAFGMRNLSVVEQISFFPLSHYDRQRNPLLPPPPPGRTNPFILNTTFLRLATSEPEAPGGNVYFAGVGFGFALTTPRDGTKATPMLSVGMRRWFQRQMGLEVSIQCGTARVGRTMCFLPVTSVWPFS